MKSYIKEKPLGLIRAETKIKGLTRELQEANEEIAVLKSEVQQYNPMYPEGIDHVTQSFLDFKREMRSPWRWFKWRFGL